MFVRLAMVKELLVGDVDAVRVENWKDDDASVEE